MVLCKCIYVNMSWKNITVQSTNRRVKFLKLTDIKQFKAKHFKNSCYKIVALVQSTQKKAIEDKSASEFEDLSAILQFFCSYLSILTVLRLESFYSVILVFYMLEITIILKLMRY